LCEKENPIHEERIERMAEKEPKKQKEKDLKKLAELSRSGSRVASALQYSESEES
jgi:hypothetical protein